MRFPKLLSSLLAVGVLAPATGFAATESQLAQFAERLIDLRAEVQGLQDDLDSAQAEHRSEMSSLRSQQAELEARLTRQRLALEDVQEELSQKEEDVGLAGLGAEELKPVLNEAMARAEENISTHLPFKSDERRAALDEIRRRIDSGVLSPFRGVNELWTFYQDEIRLGTETGLFRDSIALDGEQRLADVVRIGMVLQYFRVTTADGTLLGGAVQNGDQWSYRTASDPAAKDGIDQLFQRMDRQVRTGLFTLPNPESFPAE